MHLTSFNRQDNWIWFSHLRPEGSICVYCRRSALYTFTERNWSSFATRSTVNLKVNGLEWEHLHWSFYWWLREETVCVQKTVTKHNLLDGIDLVTKLLVYLFFSHARIYASIETTYLIKKSKNNEGDAWSGNRLDIFPSVICFPLLFLGYGLICETEWTSTPCSQWAATLD